MKTSVNRLIKSGDASFDKGEYNNAIQYYSQAIKRCKAMPKTRAASLALADAYNGMGHALRSKHQFAKSKHFQEQALGLYRKLHKKDKKLEKRLALSLHYMADIAADLNQIDRSLDLYREELRIARRRYSKDKKDIFYLVYGLNGSAARLSDKKNFNGAISLLQESLRVQRAVTKHPPKKSYPNLSWSYHILGATFLKSGDTGRAITNLKKALEMRLIIADKNKRYIAALSNTLDALSSAYKKRDSTAA